MLFVDRVYQGGAALITGGRRDLYADDEVFIDEKLIVIVIVCMFYKSFIQ